MLTEALNGRFTAHHAFMTRLFLDRIDAHTTDIGCLGADRRVDGTFSAARDLLKSIPGFSRTVAEVFIAETGGDMSQFPTAGHLASWAGVSPGSNESAGRVKSTKTRPGNRYLKGALGVAALSAARSKNTYFSAKFRRTRPTRTDESDRRGRTRHAHRRLAHAHQRRVLPRSRRRLLHPPRPAKTKARAVRQLEALGYTVTLTPLADTA